MFQWSQKLRSEKLGLTMIAGSLLVVAVIVSLLTFFQQAADLNRIRAQGLSLAQLVSEVPFEQLLAEQSQNTLHIVYQSQPKAELAYVAVVNTEGMPLAQITAPGVVIPQSTSGARPGSWIGEHTAMLSDGAEVIEYYAPILSGGELQAFIRIAYFYPQLAISMTQLPLMASLALPVFLLTPLFYILLRREIRPLRRAHQQIAQQVSSTGASPLQLTMGEELTEFADNFNSFFKLAAKKIAALENERATLQASSKILDYKFNKFEAMLEAIPDALIVLDESGTVIFANSKLLPVFGIAADDALLRPLATWCDNSELFAFITRCQKSKSVAINPVQIALQLDKLTKRVSVSAFPLFAEGDQHKLLGRLIVLRDTSREAAAEASRDEFIGHISHELKTPLHTMGLYIEQLQHAANDEAFRVEGLNILHDETERMTDLINNILSITKIENGSLAVDRQRVKLGELLKDALATVQRSDRAKNVTIVADIPSEVGAVAIDKNLMRVAINNLLTNAIKYNRPHGEVRLELEELPETVRITVKDSGIGIAAEDQLRIFDKFYRSEDDTVRGLSGHGLGLSLVRDIVNLHNGKISVHSELGSGSEFVIEFYKESEQLRKAG